MDESYPVTAGELAVVVRPCVTLGFAGWSSRWGTFEGTRRVAPWSVERLSTSDGFQSSQTSDSVSEAVGSFRDSTA